MRKERDLTDADIAIIKGMAARKDRQVDIAYYFEVPQVVVWRVLNDAQRRAKRWGHVEPAPLEQLPPKGPYKVVPVDLFTKLSDAAAVPVKLIEDLMGRLDALQASVDNLHMTKVMAGAGEGNENGRTPHVSIAQTLHS